MCNSRPAQSLEEFTKTVQFLLSSIFMSSSFLLYFLICSFNPSDLKHSCMHFSDSQTLPWMKLHRIFVHVGPDATRLIGTLSKPLHSQSHLNDPSVQWENFNGSSRSKEAANLLTVASLPLRWNSRTGREEAWRGRETSSLTLQFQYRVF